MTTITEALAGVKVAAPVSAEQEAILSPEALGFFAALQREFNARRRELLAARKQRQARWDAGAKLDFLPETKSIREQSWRVDPVPADMQDRRVEITGPVDRKMVINALNSGAKTYMADFEDSHTPMWEGTLAGQLNLRDAVRGMIAYVSPEGKEYRLGKQIATLIVRPRGWHLDEKHILVDGEPASGSLFDFAMYFFHNAHYRRDHGLGSYFYLPKMEHHLEARLWNDVFTRAEEIMGLPEGHIKATVLIETLPAAFQMEEILYELRKHSSGLNCGRWDYIFSYIKKLGRREDCIVPDRAQVTMTAPFMRAYTLSCIHACHKHGAHAMGGMAAQIPIKNDPAANEAAIEKVRQDKRREAVDGFDGTWVAHPGLVGVAMEEFDKVLGDRPNQVEKLRDDVRATAADLVEPPRGQLTEAGLRQNVSVGIQYLANWLRGNGCVPLYNLMEDAATAEISRTQVWQWVHHPKGVLEDGRRVDIDLVRAIEREELGKLEKDLGETHFAEGRYREAADLFDKLVADNDLAEFLTLAAYEKLP